jgi:S-adenosylmethionine hydrolase
MPHSIRPVVTLITDFGLAGPYVGTMKGVMININPLVRLVDITHDITSHDVLEAALILQASYRFFPGGSVHLVVVDPTVGSERRPILVITDRYSFIGPDNGVLSPAFIDPTFQNCIELTAKRYFLDEIGSTFHGRDIFGPVAAWLSKGVEPESFGEEIKDYVQIPLPEAHFVDDAVEGRIIYIDHFGNLVSNITYRMIETLQARTGSQRVTINIAGRTVKKILRSYETGSATEPNAIINSWGNLEIFVKRSSACSKLSVRRGEPVVVKAG